MTRKEERLKSAYKEIRKGKTIEFTQDKDKEISKSGCKCRIIKSQNKYYIYYNFFGSSAREITLYDLRWIAEKIGNCTTYEYKII